MSTPEDIIDAIKTPEAKQKLAKAIVEQASKPEAKAKITEDIGKITKVVANIRESFKVTGSKLRVIDIEELDGGKKKWGTDWETYRKNFETILNTSRASASEIAGYALRFEETVVRHVNRSDSELARDKKIKLLNSHIESAKKFEQNSTDIANDFRGLITNLENFKKDFSAWIRGLGQAVSQEIQTLDAEISTLNGRVKSLKDQIAMLTAVGGAVTAAGALGLIPAFTVFVLIGALVALAVGAYLMNDLNTKLSEAEDAVNAKQAKKVELSKKLDKILAVQKQFEAEISDQIDNINNGVGLFETIWRNVAADCKEIAEWLEKGAAAVDAPPTMYAYTTSGSTLYSSLAEALTKYATGVAPA
jgi:predicted  nucleic acid-binding Zn-ribbon protein